jgi:hypothetical protein
LVDKTPIVGVPGTGQSHTLLVEKEAMAPRTFDGLAHETTSGGRICHGIPEFANVDGLAPTFAFSPGQVLHPRVLDSVVYGRHSLRMAPVAMTKINND